MHPHLEFSSGITSRIVCGSKLLCSDGHLGRLRWFILNHVDLCLTIRVHTSAPKVQPACIKAHLSLAMSYVESLPRKDSRKCFKSNSDALLTLTSTLLWFKAMAPEPNIKRFMSPRCSRLLSHRVFNLYCQDLHPLPLTITAFPKARLQFSFKHFYFLNSAVYNVTTYFQTLYFINSGVYNVITCFFTLLLHE